MPTLSPRNSPVEVRSTDSVRSKKIPNRTKLNIFKNSGFCEKVTDSARFYAKINNEISPIGNSSKVNKLLTNLLLLCRIRFSVKNSQPSLVVEYR